MLITSFFTNNSVPQTGLTPLLRIWEVTPSSQTLIVNNDPMVEVGDGFYKYDFIAYDVTKDYVFRADGGGSQPIGERYQFGATQAAIINNNQISNIAAEVWDVDANNHLLAGSTGERLALIKADTTTINVNVSVINSLVQLLLKYERNRTKIDTVAKTLTVYDDDCVTPLQVFNLRDSTGAPSVTDVCERSPTTCP